MMLKTAILLILDYYLNVENDFCLIDSINDIVDHSLSYEQHIFKQLELIYIERAREDIDIETVDKNVNEQLNILRQILIQSN